MVARTSLRVLFLMAIIAVTIPVLVAAGGTSGGKGGGSGGGGGGDQPKNTDDNPPPKLVQGYKFKFFYPDLIDKSQATMYEIINEPGTSDTVLIMFRAGPPY
ncbi:hypothetical protein BGZ98_004033 [Dissophora globulifera]|nr:hypothetical protein BGZ98_004033 [Dissophora globulifera]